MERPTERSAELPVVLTGAGEEERGKSQDNKIDAFQ